eukprot:COSAG01_NODE_7816_length_3045_cov_6.803802_1_plen_494_part_00
MPRPDGSNAAGSPRASFADLLAAPPGVLDDNRIDADMAVVDHSGGGGEEGEGAAARCAKASVLGRWAGAIFTYAAICGGLWLAIKLLFFGAHAGLSTCDSRADKHSRDTIDWFIGTAPLWMRNAVLVGGTIWALRRCVGYGSRDLPGPAQLLLGVGTKDGAASRAGWKALVSGSGSNEPFPSFEQARQSRGLTPGQATMAAVTKLVMWHMSQPVTYVRFLCCSLPRGSLAMCLRAQLWLLWAFRCYVAELGTVQQNLACVVAVREVLYLVSTVFALFRLPAFLLVDLKTVWNEASPLERLFRVAMYTLCPHNFVALCSANCFPEWRRSFRSLAGVQIIADFSSCFALAALLASSVKDLDGKVQSAAPLKVGYSITALGFILFFGPLSVVTSFEGALDKQRHRLVRLLRGVGGSALLISLTYVVLCFVLLLSGEDIFCRGFTFQSDPCHGHGVCYAAAQCRCTPGYGPESKVSGDRVAHLQRRRRLHFAVKILD